MRRVLLAGALVAASAANGAAPAAAGVSIQRVVSPGGIEAWLVEEHSIPMLAIELGFAGGAALDPDAAHAGRAQLMADTLEEGAGACDARELRRAADAVALRLSASVGRDRLRVGVRLLTRHRDRSVELVNLFLTQPRFEEAGVARAAARTVAGLKRALEDPDSVASLEWSGTAFPDDPYGWPPDGTPETVAALTVADLQAAHAAQFDLARLHVGVVGDIDAAELGPLLDRLFEGLPRRAAESLPPAPVPAARGIQVVERAVEQSAIRFGHAGLRRSDPDYLPAYILNYVLGGGGFESRLNRAIRQQRGFAYSAGSVLLPRQRDGLLIGGLNTGNAQVASAIEVVRTEWRKLREAGVDEAALADAKRFLTGAYALQFDSNAKIAGGLVGIQFDNLGIDYIHRRNALIEAVTTEDLRRVAARILDPDQLLFVVVGQPEGVADTLEQ